MRYIIKNNINYLFKYLLLFILLLFIFIFFSFNDLDIIWNYGFSHAIRIGEIPYKDFNMVITPFYNFLMSLPLFLNHNYISFIIFHSLFVILLFIIINRMTNNKGVYFLIISGIFLFFSIRPGYNFLSFLLIILIMFLEKEKYNTYLIGFLVGVLILTKQSIGIGFLIIYLFINYKNIYKLFIGLLLPIFIFIIYLLITNSYKEFIDLAFLGLINFSSNKKIELIPFIFLLLGSFYNIYSFIRYGLKDKLNYYLLSSYLFIIPIIDFLHMTFFVSIIIVVILIRLKDYNYKFKFINYLFLLVILIINFEIFININNKYVFSNNLYFNGYFIDLKYEDISYEISSEYKKYNAYMLSYNSMFFDIISDKKISYFSLLNNGNLGYNGINNIYNKINNMHDTYFFINTKKDNGQYVDEINDYVKNKGIFIKRLYYLDIYYLK